MNACHQINVPICCYDVMISIYIYIHIILDLVLRGGACPDGEVFTECSTSCCSYVTNLVLSQVHAQPYAYVAVSVLMACIRILGINACL